MMLWKVLSRIDRSRFEPSVIALSDSVAMLEAFEAIGVRCDVIGLRPRLRALGRLGLVGRAIRARSPEIVQGWLYHGNVAATLASGIFRPRVPVLWNIRGTLMDPQQEKKLTRFVIWLCGKLSFSPSRIINNSNASAIEHERRLGYPGSKQVVLPNGFDTDLFCPSDAARLEVRRALGLAQDAHLIGLIGRYHPMKDHGTFLQAAAILTKSHPQVHYVLAGERVDEQNAELARLIVACGVRERVHVLGQRKDMARITAALDVATSSSSSGEGFPNVIGEAMSCAVPCAVTDVGDSAWLVGEAGRAVAPGNPQALARALAELIELPPQRRQELGRVARQRIVDHFSLDNIVRRYEALYVSVRDEFRRIKEV